MADWNWKKTLALPIEIKRICERRFGWKVVDCKNFQILCRLAKFFSEPILENAPPNKKGKEACMLL
jgi:hypothetical protein